MITVDEAKEIILRYCEKAKTERIHFNYATNRVLAQNIYAERDFPPYNRVTMDGIAINFSSYEKGNRGFRIQEIAPAGEAQKSLNKTDQCIEVMTGAILPAGTDTVIRYEDLEIEKGIAQIKLNDLKYGKNVHTQGSDRKKGSLLMASGKSIGAPEVGVISTVGIEFPEVYCTPKVAIISSGDELVEVNEQPQAHQIRRSNNYSIDSALNMFNLEVGHFHYQDSMEEIENELRKVLDEYDVLILSGGVSKGKFDFIPEALNNLNVKKLFHRVKQRPGKPFWFGVYGNNPVFALPGNPVSSFMCTHKYVIPWLKKHLGMNSKNFYAQLASDIHFKPDLHYYAQVKLESNQKGHLLAFPIEGNGSGDLANLTEVDAFIELPRGKDLYLTGETYRILAFRDFRLA